MFEHQDITGVTKTIGKIINTFMVF